MFNYPGDNDVYKHFVKLDVVHIDDVASAHIFLLDQYVNAKAGRYICSSAHITIHELFESLSAKYPEFQISIPE